MKKIELNSEELKKIKDLYLIDGLNTRKIGEIMKISKPIIIKILRENGVKIRNIGQKYKGGKKEAAKRYYKKNKEKLSEYHKQWAVENKNNLHEYHSEWRNENREHVKKFSKEKEKERIKSDPIYKFKKRFRTAFYICLKERSIKKYKSTFENLPYSIEELIKHIEKQFTDEMNWDNYGEWHVDHIKPMYLFKFDSFESSDFTNCWALSNLRPMWATTREINGIIYVGNLNKGKYIE